MTGAALLQFTEVSASAAKRAWARLITQVYEVDPLVCSRCCGAMRILAFIEQSEVIEKILTHLGLWSAGYSGPARGTRAGSLGNPWSARLRRLCGPQEPESCRAPGKPIRLTYSTTPNDPPDRRRGEQ